MWSGHRSRTEFEAHIEYMYEAAQRYAIGEPLEVFARRVLELEGVIRFYVIDQDGQQCCANMESPLFAVTEDPRYAPLNDTGGASWRSRQYFRRACAVAGEVHVSSEYPSCTDGHTCTTLSVAVGNGTQVRILCREVKVT
jgi:hypothetical protein